MKRILLYNLIVSFILLWSCINSEQYNNVKEDFKDTEYNNQWKSYDSIYSKIPDYKEISSTMNKLHTGFRDDILLNPLSADKYLESKETAFALGMFVADLGFVRHYERVQLCTEFLEAVRKLAANLAVGEKEFNQTVPIIESGLSDNEVLFGIVDSLMNAGNVVLSGSEQHGISALFLAGFWVETTYIGMSLSKDLENNETQDLMISHFKILEQINNLFECLDDSKQISDIKNLLEQIENKGPESRSLYEDILVLRNSFIK